MLGGAFGGMLENVVWVLKECCHVVRNVTGCVRTAIECGSKYILTRMVQCGVSVC